MVPASLAGEAFFRLRFVRRNHAGENKQPDQMFQFVVYVRLPTYVAFLKVDFFNLETRIDPGERGSGRGRRIRRVKFTLLRSLNRSVALKSWKIFATEDIYEQCRSV